jgi:hypothetical protein
MDLERRGHLAEQLVEVRRDDPAGHGGSLARWQGMRRLPIYRRGTDFEVRDSERSPLWQGMGRSLSCAAVTVAIGKVLLCACFLIPMCGVG